MRVLTDAGLGRVDFLILFVEQHVEHIEGVLKKLGQ